MSNTFPPILETDLEDIAQTCGGIDYVDISKLSGKWESLDDNTRKNIKDLNSEFRYAASEIEDLDEIDFNDEPKDDDIAETIAIWRKLVTAIKSAI